MDNAAYHLEGGVWAASDSEPLEDLRAALDGGTDNVGFLPEAFPRYYWECLLKTVQRHRYLEQLSTASRRKGYG